MSFPESIRSSDDPLDLDAAARDLWPKGTLDLWQGRMAPRPARVCWPESAEELTAVLAFAQRAKLPVVTYGAGSGVCGGSRGLPGSLVVDTKAFSHIEPIDEQSRTVWAGAGVVGEQLEEWLEARGYTIGHSPSSIACSTVGGWAAARSAGQFSSKYGVFEDMVLAVRAVSPGRGAFMADGDELDVLIGSEGTLAVITAVQIRVHPLPEHRWLRGYRFDDIESALEAMRGLMQAELWPAVVRLYDPVDTRIGGRTKAKHAAGESAAFYKDWIKALDEMPAVRHRTLGLPLALPGLIMRIFDAVASGCLVIVGFEGDRAVVEASVKAAGPILAKGEDLGEEPGKRWYDSRHAVSYKLMPIFERGGFADTMEIAGRWSVLRAAYDAVREAVSRHAIVMAHMSHVYPEGGCIYFSFAGTGDQAVYDALWKSAQEAVLAAGATTTHHHGVGILKAPYASLEVGSAVEGWRSAKREHDPAGILNPGRLYVPVQGRSVAPAVDLRPEDGLGSARLGEARPDAMWPWASLPMPKRAARNPWQSGWINVEGEVAGQRVSIGRGPRSAAGPDLRSWLVRHGERVRVTYAAVAAGDRRLGVARPADPWKVAHALLRSDLRPARLDVVDGELRVGFRGPAAADLLQIAGARVPGGLTDKPWEPFELASGDLVPCGLDDPRIVAVGLHGGLRRA